MGESTAASKKHLALDTDWMSAAIAVCAIFAFGLLGAAMVWTMLHREVSSRSVTWWTPLLAAGFIYLAMESRDKLFRVVIVIYTIGPVSRTALWLARASAPTLFMNEILVQWMDTGLYFAICIYAVYWLLTKIRHVSSSA